MATTLNSNKNLIHTGEALLSLKDGTPLKGIQNYVRANCSGGFRH